MRIRTVATTVEGARGFILFLDKLDAWRSKYPEKMSYTRAGPIKETANFQTTSTLSLLIEFPVDSDLSFFFLTWDGWFPDYFLDDTNEETRIQTIIENIQRNLTE